MTVSFLSTVRAQCPPPIQVGVTNVTTSTFTVFWSSTGNEILWEIIVVPVGTVPTPGDNGMMATVNPFVITGLSCGTYAVYVRSVCDGIAGPWSSQAVIASTCQGTTLPPVTVCDTGNDGLEMVYLGIYNMEFEGQMPPGNYEFSYYLSEMDALNQANPLPELAMVPTMVVIVRADNLDSPGTFQLFELFVIVQPGPELPWGTNLNLEVCDPNMDGFATFDLNALSMQIYSATGQTPNTWGITYYESEFDAEGGFNAISNTSAYTNISQSTQQIYVRIQDFGTGCQSIYPVMLQVENCEGILLHAFLDENNNGIWDNGEPAFPYGNFTYSLNGAANVNLVSSNGQFFIEDNDPANEYVIGYEVEANYAGNFTTTPSVTLIAGPGVQEVHFAVTAPQPFNDLVIALIPFQQPQPGFNYTNKILVSNLGTSQQSGTVTFTKDPAVTLVTMPTGAVSTPTGFTMDFSNLMPFETRQYNVVMQVPTIPTVQLGDLLTNLASVTLPDGDILPANNTATLTQTIVGSYDPNDKVEAHGGKIVLEQFEPNSELIYTIRFENTGTAPASFITIQDELDTQLEAGSLRMIAASHDYVLTKNGHSLSWFFGDIDLPPTSQDPVGSHGYLTFAVKTFEGLAVGDIISNTASIYFDYNPAIVTNTFQTEFVAALSTPDHSATAFTIHPNPASAMVYISSEQMVGKIIISDMTGKRVAAQDLIQHNPAIDISALQQGLYLIEVTLHDGTRSVQKLIKN